MDDAKYGKKYSFFEYSRTETREKLRKSDDTPLCLWKFTGPLPIDEDLDNPNRIVRTVLYATRMIPSFQNRTLASYKCSWTFSQRFFDRLPVDMVPEKSKPGYHTPERGGIFFNISECLVTIFLENILLDVKRYS